MVLKKGKNFIIISVEIYKRGVILFFGNREDFIAKIRKEAPTYEDEVRQCVIAEDWETTKAITIPCGDIVVYAPSVPTLPVIVHELAHAAEHILKKVGVDSEDGEAFAYLQEYLFEEVCSWLNVPCDVRLP